MNNQPIFDTICYLFDKDFGEYVEEYPEEELENEAIDLVKKYGWKCTYSVFTQYLFQEVTTPEKAINVANILWGHPWLDQNIPDIYALLSYFYYGVNMDADRYDSQGILDAIAVESAVMPALSGQRIVCRFTLTAPVKIRMIRSRRRTRSAGLINQCICMGADGCGAFDQTIVPISENKAEATLAFDGISGTIMG